MLQLLSSVITMMWDSHKIFTFLWRADERNENGVLAEDHAFQPERRTNILQLVEKDFAASVLINFIIFA